MTNITFTKCLGEQMKNEDIKTHAKIKILIMVFCLGLGWKMQKKERRRDVVDGDSKVYLPKLYSLK